MRKVIITCIIAAAVVSSAAILGWSYRYKYDVQDNIVVTGLAEQEFSSDLIVWRANLTAKNNSLVGAYQKLENDKTIVEEYFKENNIPDSSITFQFVRTSETTEARYVNGQYTGQQRTGYELTQEFSVQSYDVEKVETVSREISSLLAKGVTIESWSPAEYYYTKLSDLKMELIEKATADGKGRAEQIATQSGSKLKSLKSGRLGVFQITGANSTEALSAGGAFNTSSREKKARITIRMEYHIK
ncbi:MAG: SIMPL domain-containing protein [Rikenellaceae bacterium]